MFLKYYWAPSYPALAPTLTRAHLLLFPDGTAFDDIPDQPVPDFDAATLRARLPPRDVGTWKSEGGNLVLTFPQQRVTLTPHPKGWLDAGRGPDMKGPLCNVYFPVTPASRAQMLGAWTSEDFGAAGTLGGAAPGVAGGSQSAWRFNADGSFSGRRDSFFSATTSNMGDGFKAGADVSVAHQGQKEGAGRWRLDGPLLTLEQNGRRTVHLAFFLPNWGKPNSGLSVDGDVWERPKGQ